MNDNDVDRATLAVGAVGLAWGLNQIRKTAPRLYAAIAFLFLVVFAALMIWFSVDLFHYMLTTPACERNGTCAVSQGLKDNGRSADTQREPALPKRVRPRLTGGMP